MRLVPPFFLLPGTAAHGLTCVHVDPPCSFFSALPAPLVFWAWVLREGVHRLVAGRTCTVHALQSTAGEAQHPATCAPRAIVRAEGGGGGQRPMLLSLLSPALQGGRRPSPPRPHRHHQAMDGSAPGCPHPPPPSSPRRLPRPQCRPARGHWAGPPPAQNPELGPRPPPTCRPCLPRGLALWQEVPDTTLPRPGVSGTVCPASSAVAGVGAFATPAQKQQGAAPQPHPFSPPPPPPPLTPPAAPAPSPAPSQGDAPLGTLAWRRLPAERPAKRGCFTAPGRGGTPACASAAPQRRRKTYILWIFLRIVFFLHSK